MSRLQTASLVAATVTTGITAGVFGAFAFSVMPGISGTDDAVFVDTMNRMNDAIENGWFMTAFVGGLLFTGAALIAVRRGGARAALPWIGAGLALYFVVFVITIGINVPLNDELATFGQPGGINDAASARDDFEDPWVVWNIIRTVANVAAFACLGYALVLLGRSAAQLDERPAMAVRQPTTTWAPPVSVGA